MIAFARDRMTRERSLDDLDRMRAAVAEMWGRALSVLSLDSFQMEQVAALMNELSGARYAVGIVTAGSDDETAAWNVDHVRRFYDASYVRVMSSAWTAIQATR